MGQSLRVRVAFSQFGAMLLTGYKLLEGRALQRTFSQRAFSSFEAKYGDKNDFNIRSVSPYVLYKRKDFFYKAKKDNYMKQKCFMLM